MASLHQVLGLYIRLSLNNGFNLQIIREVKEKEENLPGSIMKLLLKRTVK